jgi:hypothetical protein
MTNANETGLQLTLVRDVKNIPIAIAVQGVIPFDPEDGFAEEKDGMTYDKPQVARGTDSKLGVTFAGNKVKLPLEFAENYADLPILKDGKQYFYVKMDGTLTVDPYTDASKKTIKKGIVLETRQATPKRRYSQNVPHTAELIWPDGKVRKFHFEVKANEPLTPAEAADKKSQATQKRQATSVQAAVEKGDAVLVNAMIVRAKSSGKSLEAIVNMLETAGLTVPDTLLAEATVPAS